MPDSGRPLRIVLAPAAQADIREALICSQDRFGERAAARYRVLLKQAIRDIAADPERPGSHDRHELTRGTWTYPLFFNRDRARSDLGVVGKRRHFLVYRRREGLIDIVRVLHDSREFERHIPADHLGNLKMSDPDDN